MKRLIAAGLLAAACTFGCTGAKPVPTGSGGGADALVEQGQREMKDGRTDEALMTFRRALAADPSSTTAMRALVEGHFRTGRIALITSELEGRVKAQPSDDLAHYGLGLAFFAKAADAEGKAVAELTKAVSLKPEMAEYHFRLGVVHLEAERYPEAVTSLKRARELDATQAKFCVPLAMALSRTGDRRGAVDALRAMLELGPDAKDVGTAKKVMARLNDTFREFPKAIEGDFQRGIDFMDRLDSPQQAIVTFEEILERFPDLAVVHAALGLCFQRLDDAGRALDELKRAQELAPEDGRNHQYVADLYFGKERYDRASEGYLASIERDPLNDHAYERLGQIALQRGSFTEAVKWLKTLAVLRPGDPQAGYNLGLAYLGDRDLGNAEKQFLRVLDADPKNAEVLMRLGLLWAERQKQEKSRDAQSAAGDKAASYFEKVLDLQPQNVLAARMLKTVKP